MAIDADLNSGVIDQEEAKIRRAEIAQESDFFGSMDGASKFVRGDAIAGLLILIINIIGGLTIGITQYDMSFKDAGEIYVLLTIGDCLVAQIPSLILSLATAIIVTRVTTNQSMTDQTTSQLANPTALFVTAAILLLLGIIPGMPSTVFISLAAVSAGIGLIVYRLRDNEQKNQLEQDSSTAPSTTLEEQDVQWEDVSQVDLISLEIGYGLIPLVNTETGGQLLSRVKGFARNSHRTWFPDPTVRIRDNLDLEPNTYHLLVNGVPAAAEKATGEGTGDQSRSHFGTNRRYRTKEPAFGLDAVWIEPSQRDHARTLGYTVVDPPTAIATHLNSLLMAQHRSCSVMMKFNKFSIKQPSDLQNSLKTLFQQS